MSEDDDGETIEAELAELTETVEQLRRELERNARPPLIPRPPRRAELREFTSEVAIPGMILLLETNIRALKLFQRTLRLADDAGPDSERVRTRAGDVGASALRRLDDALSEVQSAMAGASADEQAQNLLERAQSLQADIESQLDGAESRVDPGPTVDVEAELQSIKDQVDRDDDESNR